MSISHSNSKSRASEQGPIRLTFGQPRRAFACETETVPVGLAWVLWALQVEITAPSDLQIC